MSACRYIDINTVAILNQRFSPSGIRDMSALKSAVYQCQQSAFGQELHPSLEEKAAVLLRGIARNHAFIDGNKRTALLTADVFLRANGCYIQASRQDLVNFVVDLAQGALALEQITTSIASWLTEQ